MGAFDQDRYLTRVPEFAAKTVPYILFGKETQFAALYCGLEERLPCGVHYPETLVQIQHPQIETSD